MTHKKNSFWRFLFSLIPGAGEMYMGFLKMGVSLMALFILIIFVAASLGFGSLVVIDLIVWFYSFFHVHNLASLSDEEFYAIEDRYLFSLQDSIQGKELFQNNHRIAAAVLIFIGIVMTWQGLLGFLDDFLPWEIYTYIRHLSYELPRVIAGIAIIALGFFMIRGKKKSLDEIEFKEEEHGTEE